jgi:GT2 family glycosyltransferase/glycosyltransferase involved in cell wall biosynthesis
MNRFWEPFIEPVLRIRQPKVIVEIGAESGANTEKLLQFCREHDAVLHAIDPHPKFDVGAWVEEYGERFIFHRDPSLTALPRIGAADAVLIDGDHNWYTVYHELLLIEEAAQDSPRGFPVVFLHDIGWPYGRRDMYYDPDRIPSEHRQQCRQLGLAPGVSPLLDSGGLNAHLFNAVSEGGPRNGVLTAVEDFLRTRTESWEFVEIPALQGLGIIAPVSERREGVTLGTLLASLSRDAVLTPYIETLESDRLRYQVRVAELAQSLNSARQHSEDQQRLLSEQARHIEVHEQKACDLARELADRERAHREEMRRADESTETLRAELRTVQAALEGVEEDLQRQTAAALAAQQEAEARGVLANAVAAERRLASEALERARAELAAERRQKSWALSERELAVRDAERHRVALAAERQVRAEETRDYDRLSRETARLTILAFELAHQLETTRQRSEAQARLVADEARARQDLQERVRELEGILEARERHGESVVARLEHELAELRHEAQNAQDALVEMRAERELALFEVTKARVVAALRHRQSELSEAALNRMSSERDALDAALEAERRQKSEAIEERKQALREAQRQRTAAEAERLARSEGDNERARLDRALRRERAGKEEALAALLAETQEAQRFRTAVEGALVREDEFARLLLEVGRELGKVDSQIGKLAKALAGQESPKRANQQLQQARRDLDRIQLALAQAHVEYASDSTNDLDANGADGEQATQENGSTAPRAARNPSPVDLQSAEELPSIGGQAGPRASGRDQIKTVDVVICVHNSLVDIRQCFDSVARHTPPRTGVVVVDDGSDDECAAYLRAFTSARRNWTLLRCSAATGYTRAANRGLRASRADLVVLLNSDTIVTANWLDRIVECAASDPAIGVVGPLSNAASYQSVPERFGANGDWEQNALPPGWLPDDMAEAVARVSNRAFPRVPFVNGFCFAIKRRVIEAIGYFDDEGFPDGYGEENDYCLRTADAGFQLAIADHAYVFHAKSRSYSHERRRELGKRGRAVLLRRYGIERLRAGEEWLREEPTLAAIRRALGTCIEEPRPASGAPRILFLLPVSGGGGGAHSVVQEASGMRRLGVDAHVAVRATLLPTYRKNYAGIADTDRLFFGYASEDELIEHAAGFSVVIATIHTSVPLLAKIARAHPAVRPAYYIQDYEPFFYAEGSAERVAAERSYTLVPNAVLFAKTDWLRRTVGERHGVEVHKVSPSLDHDVYFPPDPRPERNRVHVAAMVRPRSARRGAGRTMEVLRRLDKEFGRKVSIHIFGCSDVDLKEADLPTDFRFTNHGVLTREEVAVVLRESDVFLDLSDYQAFGRTGLEAMACGCAVIVPACGGADEYALHELNALVVDTSATEKCYEAAKDLVLDVKLRERLRKEGLGRIRRFSIERAAGSELETLGVFYNRREDDIAPRRTALPANQATSRRVFVTTAPQEEQLVTELFPKW